MPTIAVFYTVRYPRYYTTNSVNDRLSSCTEKKYMCILLCVTGRVFGEKNENKQI